MSDSTAQPAPALTMWPLQHVPMVAPGDDLAGLLLQALTKESLELEPGDILVCAQKIVSKAEHRQFALNDITPGAAAEQLAKETEKDPSLVELILQESTEVLRKKPGVIIVRHRLGLVGANAGIDQSNIDHGDDAQALLLPKDPDASASALAATVFARTAVPIGVVIADSMNRPWRLGTIGGAIGCAGVDVLEDHRGGEDLYGRELKVTLINRADALAAAATLLMGETTEKIPAVLVRGFAPSDTTQTAAAIPRPLEEDMFR